VEDLVLGAKVDLIRVLYTSIIEIHGDFRYTKRGSCVSVGNTFVTGQPVWRKQLCHNIFDTSR
jgi:hypothetical protein